MKMRRILGQHLWFLIAGLSIAVAQGMEDKCKTFDIRLYDSMFLIGSENVDNDPALEIVCISDAPIDPIIHIYDGATGREQWTSTEWRGIKMFVTNVDNPYPVMNVQLKDIDKDGKAELIFLGRRKTETETRLHILEY